MKSKHLNYQKYQAFRLSKTIYSDNINGLQCALYFISIASMIMIGCSKLQSRNSSQSDRMYGAVLGHDSTLYIYTELSWANEINLVAMPHEKIWSLDLLAYSPACFHCATTAHSHRRFLIGVAQWDHRLATRAECRPIPKAAWSFILLLPPIAILGWTL